MPDDAKGALGSGSLGAAGTLFFWLGVLVAVTGLAWFLLREAPSDGWDVVSSAPALLLMLAGGLMAALGALLRRLAESRQVALLGPEDEERVLRAIHSFESRTSGEIRVHLASRLRGEILDDARRTFEKLGMSATAQRNGVLFFVSVAERRFAVLGDEGIDARVPEDFWEDCLSLVRELFREGRFADGLVAGIELAGRALAEHFPVESDDVNELPDEISRS